MCFTHLFFPAMTFNNHRKENHFKQYFFKAYCSDKKLLLDHICGKLIIFSSDLPFFQYPHDTPCVVCCRSGGNRGGRADRAAAEPAVPATSPNLFCKRALRKAGKDALTELQK